MHARRAQRAGRCFWSQASGIPYDGRMPEKYMRSLLVCLTLMLGACAQTQRGPADGAELLFDGATLNGWHAHGGGTWSVEDGVIVGRASREESAHGLLVSDREFADFVLEFDYCVYQGNSGFYFRSEETDDAVGVHGFQVEVDDVMPGGLYETAGRGWVVRRTPDEAKAWHRVGEWNAVVLTAVGESITVTVNGIETARLIDPDGRRSGRFAMQLHGNQDMHVAFRGLRYHAR